MDLFSIPAVSILISVVISWALFALACSMVHEVATRITAERGKFMQKYLLQQLADVANDINWGLELYRQPPVALLTRDIKKPTDQIDTETFVVSLVSAVANSNLVLTKLQALEKDARPVAAGAGPEAVAKQAAAAELLAALNAIKDPLLRRFKAATELLHFSDQAGLFKTAMANAELKTTGATANEAGVYANVLAGLKEWHNGLEDRLSLWYKKITQTRLFFLGLIFAIVINVDSLQLFHYYNQNPKARQFIIETYARDSAYYDNLAKLQLNTVSKDSLKTITTKFASGLQSLADSTGLPVGFDYSVFKMPPKPSSWQNWLLKALGLIISGFAASVGAPFWFDLLKKAFSVKAKI